MNCNGIKFYGLFILLFFLNSYCFAQNNTASTDSASVVDLADSIVNDYGLAGDTVIVKTIFDSDNDSILKWKKSPEFGYMAFLDSLLRKKKSGLKMDTFNINNNNSEEKVRKATSSNSGEPNGFLNSFPVKIFFWLVAIFFIGFILYRLFVTGGLFEKKAVKYDHERNAEEPEKLGEYSAYNALIYEAESQGDFNQAIRYLYLQALKKLSDNELILFSPGKTNNSYIKELSGKEYQNDFIVLTHNYEYAWYGKFLINSSKYQQLKDQFITFNKKV